MPLIVNQPGALPDSRSLEEKQKDYKIEEIVAGFAPVKWEKKTSFRKFPIYDQNGSGSCVAQTLRKMIGIYIQQKTGEFIPVSASHIYQRRSNKPSAGMAGVDAFKIAQKGVTLEVFAKSEKLTDTQMDATQVSDFEFKVGEIFKIGSYLEVPIKSIDTIASLIQETGKGVMVWFYFDGSEWTERPRVKFPLLDKDSPSTIRHSVTAVDFSLTTDNKKAIIIDDSWGPKAGNGAGQRVIDEDFFKSRNWFAAHFMNFAFEEEATNKPKYLFLKDLQFSPNPTLPDPDIVALQDVLKYEGLFPSNVSSTGYFGALTKVAVGEFQKKYQIAQPTDSGFGRVGPKTRVKLNELYN